MQVSSINNNIINIKSSEFSSPFKSGTQIKATITQVNNDGTIVMESNSGVFTAANTTGYSLQVGDMVSLLVTTPSQDGSAATTALTQINGQPIDQNVSLSEMHLIDLGIMPNPSNLKLYNILNKFQLPLTKEIFLNLKEVFASLPSVTDEQAAFMAATGVKPTLENLNALTGIGTLHEDVAALISESLAGVISEYGITDDAINNIIASLNAALEETATVEQQPLASPPTATDANAAPDKGITPQLPIENETAIEQSPLQISPANQGVKTEGTVINQTSTVIPEQFIPDKNAAVLELTNYLETSVPKGTLENKSLEPILPKIIEGVATALTKQLETSPQVTLKLITELNVNGKLPEDLQQIISALPKEVQQQLDLIIPKVLQSAKEFLSVKLLHFTDNQFQVRVAPEVTTGSSLKQNVKSIASNVNAVLTDKAGDAAQRTVTSLKLSDNTMSFIQIPININDFKSTAEMYVVKRDGSKKLSLDDGVKMVFALNTENLGRLESIISANRTDLSLNIRVESATVKEAIEKELSYLKSLLNTTDFHLSTLKVTTIDKQITVLNAHTYFGYKQLDITI